MAILITILPGGQGHVPKSGEVGPLTQPEQLERFLKKSILPQNFTIFEKVKTIITD